MPFYKIMPKLIVGLMLSVFAINNISPLISFADEAQTELFDGGGASTNDSRVVVSMGDSYSSGEGTDPMYGRRDPADPNFMDWLAHRSLNSWSGQLVLPEVGELRAYKYPQCIDPQWYFVAASGATTYDIEGKQKKSYIRADGTLVKDIELPAQIDALDIVRDRDIVPEYITLTLGGNDLGFEKIVTEAAMHVTFTNPASLADMLNDATVKLDIGDGDSPSLRERLKSTYEKLDERSTIDGVHPCILVAGYPHLFNEDVYNVASTWGDDFSACCIFDLEEAGMINERIDYFDNAIESIVNELRESHKGINIEYIEIRDAFSGHEVNTADAWINPVVISHDQDLIHKIVTTKEINQDLSTADNSEFHIPISAYSVHPNYKGTTYGYRQCFQERIDYLEGLSTTPAVDYSQKDFRIGSTVTMGNYEGEDIEWIVLDNNENGVFLVTKYAVEASLLDTRNEHTGSITWENCTTRNWLNEDFYDSVFTPEEKEIIQVTHVVTPDNPAFGTPGGNDTDDRLFLLSDEEANLYFATQDLRRALPSERAVNNGVIIDDNGSYCNWWLRTPGSTDGVSNAFVDGYGTVIEVGNCSTTETYGIRPAMWLSADVSASANAHQYVSSVQTGDTITFGEYRQDADGTVRPVEWIVLDIKDEKALLISKYVLDSIQYSNDSNPTVWDLCYLRSWLNNQFIYSAFSGEERSVIVDTILKNDDSPGEVIDGNDTNDKVFVLSLSECEHYFNMSNDDLHYYGNDVCSCEPTEYALSSGLSLNTSGCCQWWTRTSGRSNNNVMYVDGDGNISIIGDAVGRIRRGVRPAMWIDLAGLENVSSADEQPVEATATWTRDGDYVIFGRYEQDRNDDNGLEPIEWEILDEQDGKMLLISRYVLDVHKFQSEGSGYVSVSWENCDLRRWLNDDFLNTAFNTSEQQLILLTTLSNPVVTGRPEPLESNDTQDKVFCLSVDEVLQYYDFDNWHEDSRGSIQYEWGYSHQLITAPTDNVLHAGDHVLSAEDIVGTNYSSDVIGQIGCWWWLRTVSAEPLYVCDVTYRGGAGWSQRNHEGNQKGVRPVIWISTSD